MNQAFEVLYLKSYKIRKRFLEIFTELGYGHLTTAFSETEILIALFYEIMDYNVQNMDSEMRDRLVVSKGHGAGMLFPILEDIGILSEDEVKDIVRVGGEHSRIKQFFYPGFEFYGGSLGIGLGMAAGLALGAKLNREDWITFCLLGDAECYEGSVWEAMMFAGHNRLNNLVAIVDRNYLGCSDFTENMCKLEPFREKWESCNWETKTVDGHSYEALIQSMKGIRTKKTSKPLCIIAETVKGKGVDYLSNIPLMHGFMPKGNEIRKAFEELEKLMGNMLSVPLEEK